MLNVRLENKVQVGGIHVTIRQHGLAGQRREGAHNAGLPGSPLPAYDHHFLHQATCALIAGISSAKIS
jgi:hypothetical protein